MLDKGNEIHLQNAALIPFHKPGDEMSLTSIFLSSLKLIKEFREKIFKATSPKPQASSLTTGPGSCRMNLERINYEKTKTRISNRWQQAPRNFRQSSRVPEGPTFRVPG